MSVCHRTLAQPSSAQAVQRKTQSSFKARFARIWRTLLFAFALCHAASAPGLVLEWNSASYSAGSLTAFFELDSSNPGADVSIVITGDTSYFINSTPNDTTDLTGGQGGSQQSLWLAVNFPSRNDTITITVNFHYAQGVSDVDFMLFDIDRGDGSYRDYITQIYAQYDAGTPLAPTSVTGSSDNTVSGSGTNRTIRGDESVDSDDNDGNATIDYGTNILNSFTFTYGDHSSAPSNPGQQWIGLYDINFTPRPRIPETHPALFAAAFCVGAVFLKRRGWLARNTTRSKS
ncbi:MAG: hypothetical protein AB1705_07605 [Verrucomicrobiota bacterium]